jgi:hypothetical protein
VHHREAGIVGDNDLARRCAQQRGEQGAGFWQALQNPVVAGVLSRLGQVVAVAGQSQHGLRQIELFRRRLAARHVELEATRAEHIILGPDLTTEGLEFVIRQVGDLGGHRCLGVKVGDL